MRDFNGLNEVVKDYAVDLCGNRKVMRMMSSGSGPISGLLIGRVNDPSFDFKVRRYSYLSYLGDIDRDLVASRVLEEL